MKIINRNYFQSVKLISNINIFSSWMLGLSTLLFLSTAETTLADRPPTYYRTIDLSIDFDQCKSRAVQASELILTKVQEPANAENVFSFFGNTAETTAALFCVRQETQGSVFIIVTTTQFGLGAYVEEAISVRDRIGKLMESGL